VRCMYWLEGLLGIILILSPYVARFAADRPALYTDVIIGVLMVLLALIGLSVPMRPSRSDTVARS